MVHTARARALASQTAVRFESGVNVASMLGGRPLGALHSRSAVPARGGAQPLFGLQGDSRVHPVVSNRLALPNPSFKRRVTGTALGPRSALVDHAPRGPSAMPLPPA
jgi:hypothetical protein